MRNFVAHRLLLTLALTAVATAQPAPDDHASPATPSPFRQTQRLSNADQQALNAAIIEENAGGADRYAAIVAGLGKAGYKLEAGTRPGVYRLVEPRGTGKAPVIQIVLYPPETSEDRFRSHTSMISASRGYNARLWFAFGQPGNDSGFPPQSPGPRELDLPSAKLLETRLYAALKELPNVKTTAPKPLSAGTVRQRDLAARIKRLEATRRLVEDWREEITRGGEEVSEPLRARLNRLEELSGKLEEAIADFQTESIALTEPAPTPPAP